MAAIQYQPSADALVSEPLFELQRELNETWSQVQDASGKAASLLRMEREARRTGANLQKVEKGIQDLENFVALVDQPGELSLIQLERLAGMLADDNLPVDRVAQDVGRISELAAQMEKLAEQMENTDKAVFRHLIGCLRDYASRWRDGLNRIQTLEQHWNDKMLSMKTLGELGKRRPLTTTERIQMLHASVIHTPVIQDPSDSREDWYDYNG